MRFPRGRLTVRRSMLLIGGVAVVLHFTVAAWQLHRTPHYHVHIGLDDGPDLPGWFTRFPQDPFWPHYWHRTLGLPIRSSRICFQNPPLVAEECSLDHPEAQTHPAPNTYAGFLTPNLRQAYLKSLRDRGRTDLITNDGQGWIGFDPAQSQYRFDAGEQ